MTPSKNTPLLSFQEIADKDVLDKLSGISSWVSAMGKYLKENKVVLPDVYDIDGSVQVTSLPPVSISNFSELTSSFKNLERQLVILHTTMSSLNASKQADPEDNQQLIRTLTKSFASLEKSVSTLGKTIGEDRVITVDSSGLPKDFAESMENVSTWMKKLYEFESNKVAFIPPPVTNVSLNPLRGVPLSTAVTVGTTATLLPATVLANRRTMIAYNNAASAVLYIGGSGVTTSNGMPIAAGVYSPPIDAGPNMAVYGISTQSINVRVLEVSNTNSGG